MGGQSVGTAIRRNSLATGFPSLWLAAGFAVALIVPIGGRAGEVVAGPRSLLDEVTCVSGGVVRVPVTLVLGGVSLCALGGEVTFDEASLVPLAVETSPSLGVLHFESFWNSRGGKLKFVIANYSGLVVLPEGVVAYLTFKALPGGTGFIPLGYSGSAASCTGADLPVMATGGSIVIVDGYPLTVTLTWNGPVRADCSPPQNLTAVLDVPGGERAEKSGAAEGPPTTTLFGGEDFGAESSLLGYDLYRATQDAPAAFQKINVSTLPADTLQFRDWTPPIGGVIYRAQAVYSTCFSDYSVPTQTEVPLCAIGCIAGPETTAGDVPLEVKFKAAAFPSVGCGAEAAYYWEFGDGGTSPEKDPWHTYTSNGRFTWVLAARAGDFLTLRSGTVTVGTPCSLSCSATATPPTGTLPLSVSFISAVTASETCPGSLAYLWDFGDGATARSEAATHSYDGAGTYHWFFTAQGGGESCSQAGTVQVTCDFPAVTALKKMKDPFRLKVEAANLKDGFRVYLGGEADPWPHVQVKEPGGFIIREAGNFFPRGDVWVEIRIENPSGCAAVIEYNWARKTWRVAGPR